MGPDGHKVCYGGWEYDRYIDENLSYAKTEHELWVCIWGIRVVACVSLGFRTSSRLLHLLVSILAYAGFLKPKEGDEKWHDIYSYYRMHSHVETIGICRLVLYFGFILNLEKTYYIFSYLRNIISISRIVPLVLSFNFSQITFSLLHNSFVMRNVTMNQGHFQNNTLYGLMAIIA